ncbi:MAG: hypothetical protein ABWX90_00870 [Candidatus Saccharimonadales bacterium]
MFLKERLATEAETRFYYRRKSEINNEGKSRGLSGKDLFAYTVAESRKLSLYFSAALDAVVYIPTDDEVFNEYCIQARIETFDRKDARRIWDDALKFAHEPRFPDDLMQRHREGAHKVRQMKHHELMDQRDRHRQRYS